MSWHDAIATVDQDAAETAVLAMWEMDVIKDARVKAAHLWRMAHGIDVPSEAESTFEEAMDEYVCSYLFKAVASDAYHPGFVRNFVPRHRRNGRVIPGARMAGENPDNCYRLCGIDHGQSYRVRAAPAGRPPAHISFSIISNYATSITIDSLDGHDITREEDGSFSVTIDDRAANGRVNHLRTGPHTKFLYVRDTMADWDAETPYSLEVERLGPAAGQPITRERMTQRAAYRLIEDIPLNYWFTRLFTGLALNTARPLARVQQLGGLAKQSGTQGRLSLNDDEAALITINPAGSDYCSAQLTDWWFRAPDMATHRSSLNQAQATEPSSLLRFVAAPRDPGVADWLDAGGLRETLLILRWQGLPSGPPLQQPDFKLQVMNVADLPSDLPRVTPEQRAEQMARRHAAVQRRYSD